MMSVSKAYLTATRMVCHIHSAMGGVSHVLVHKASQEVGARIVVRELVRTRPHERHKDEWESSNAQGCEGEAHICGVEVRYA
jgi:hypothetical protein